LRQVHFDSENDALTFRGFQETIVSSLELPSSGGPGGLRPKKLVMAPALIPRQLALALVAEVSGE